MPSTPDTDYNLDVSSECSEQEEKHSLHQYFKQQQQTPHLRQPLQNPSVVAALAAEISSAAFCGDKESNENILRVTSTPESSQTDSDDLSPQIQRRRKSNQQRALPRFSISIEDEFSA